MLPNLSGLRVGGLGECGRGGRRCAPVGMVMLAADQDEECTICAGPLRFNLGNNANGQPLADPRLPQIVADDDELVQWSWDTATLVCGHIFHRRCLATVFHTGVPQPWDCPRKLVNVPAHQGVKAHLSQEDVADILHDRAQTGFNNHLAQPGVFIPTDQETERQNEAREQARALQEASAHANQAQQQAAQQAVQAAEEARAAAEAEQAAGRAAQEDAAQQAAEAAEARKQVQAQKGGAGEARGRHSTSATRARPPRARRWPRRSSAASRKLRRATRSCGGSGRRPTRAARRRRPGSSARRV